MNNKLYSLRNDNELSQKDVARKIGITASHYGMIEIGKRTPSLIVARKLSIFFKSTIEELFFEN